MFFRKTGVKIAGTILCILSLAVGAISTFLAALLLSLGCYDGSGVLFDHFAGTLLWQDADSVMQDYFDPNEPTKPWRSYYSGGIYTGENSNFRYNIIDDQTGYSVLATVEGGEKVLLQREFTYSYNVADSAETDSEDVIYSITEAVFECNGIVYAYDAEMNAFVPLDSVSAQYVEVYTGLGPDALTHHIEYFGSYYSYDGNMFVCLADEASNETAASGSYREFTITCYILADLSAPDMYRSIYELSQLLYDIRYPLIGFAISGLLLGVLLLVLLGCTVGRKPGQEEACLPRIFRLPSDLVLLLGIFAVCVGLEACVSFYENTYLSLVLAFDGLVLLAITAVIVYCILQFCARAKTHTLISGSLIYWCIHNAGRFVRWVGRWCRKGLGYLPLVWKVLVCYVVLCLVELIAIAALFWGDGMFYFLWFVEKLALGALVTYVALVFRRLKCGAESIAAGDYNTKVNDEYMVLDFKDTADTLNHIQDGMNAAVDSRMKSERLKTELITNVSHDLKTPLTSIVSYVDLLKQEPAGSPAAAEYLEVLDRQSQRLKKLIEDLVEASKASTGNITVHKVPLDFNMLLGQALGEYAQRLAVAQLTPVLRVPEDPVMVLADGRLLWRVFDNLLGNIVKYAMPGTRVYLTVEAGQNVTASFRNISREQLDVSADELMERFVRGDASRHTEGSGLGLSIARSLTDSMGGTFSLSVDGDLFKAMVTFPVIQDPMADSEL